MTGGSRRRVIGLLFVLALLAAGLTACGSRGIRWETASDAENSVEGSSALFSGTDSSGRQDSDNEPAEPVGDNPALPPETEAEDDAADFSEKTDGSPETAAEIPDYSGIPVITIHGNVPFFTEEERAEEAFESYAPLDALGRCGTAFANICPELMPEEERGTIGGIRPTGWHTVKYEGIDGNYLYNRCHLIAYSLAGENDNECNLITGTRYLNIISMLPYEILVHEYVQRTGNHVLYRVTPYYQGEDLVAEGILMEGLSLEDGGDGICFCVYCYNIQPGIRIDYTTGESEQTEVVYMPELPSYQEILAEELPAGLPEQKQ